MLPFICFIKFVWGWGECSESVTNVKAHNPARIGWEDVVYKAQNTHFLLFPNNLVNTGIYCQGDSIIYSTWGNWAPREVNCLVAVKVQAGTGETRLSNSKFSGFFYFFNSTIPQLSPLMIIYYSRDYQGELFFFVFFFWFFFLRWTFLIA
jgi:hypothetical protein